MSVQTVFGSFCVLDFLKFVSVTFILRFFYLNVDLIFITQNKIRFYIKLSQFLTKFFLDQK